MARWLAQHGGMKPDDAKRLKELEGENARLKKLLAEAELDKAMLKELAEDGQVDWSPEGHTPARVVRRFVGQALTLEASDPEPAPGRGCVCQDRFGVSERHACRVVGQHRSIQRLEPPPPDHQELTRPGMSGDSVPWEGWSHVGRQCLAEVSAGVEGARCSDGG